MFPHRLELAGIIDSFLFPPRRNINRLRENFHNYHEILRLEAIDFHRSRFNKKKKNERAIQFFRAFRSVNREKKGEREIINFPTVVRNRVAGEMYDITRDISRKNNTTPRQQQ